VLLQHRDPSNAQGPCPQTISCHCPRSLHPVGRTYQRPWPSHSLARPAQHPLHPLALHQNPRGHSRNGAKAGVAATQRSQQCTNALPSNQTPPLSLLAASCWENLSKALAFTFLARPAQHPLHPFSLQRASHEALHLCWLAITDIRKMLCVWLASMNGRLYAPARTCKGVNFVWTICPVLSRITCRYKLKPPAKALMLLHMLQTGILHPILESSANVQGSKSIC